MADNPSKPDRSQQATDEDIIRFRITPHSESAGYELLETIAELENTDIKSLPSFYDQVDHFVETMLQNPPAPEAQMEISFSYAGSRIPTWWVWTLIGRLSRLSPTSERPRPSRRFCAGYSRSRWSLE